MIKFVSLLLFLATSAFLVWFLMKGDRGSREPRSALVGAFGFGVLAVLAAVWAEFLFVPNPTEAFTVVGVLIASLGIGVVEEAAKFVPMALFIRNKSYFNEHTDGVIYFAIVGLTFGFLENIAYLFIYSSKLGGSDMTGIFRLITLFFFHAAATGIVGYYLAKAKLHKQSLWRPAIALAIVMVIHSLYDFMLFYIAHKSATTPFMSENQQALLVVVMVGGLIISALLNTFLFLYYWRARQWDFSTGLAVDPNRSAQAALQAPQPHSA